jgi:hypothetical protein
LVGLPKGGKLPRRSQALTVGRIFTVAPKCRVDRRNTLRDRRAAWSIAVVRFVHCRRAMMNRTIPVFTTLLALSAFGCEKSGQEAQEKTDNAQAQASTEITNAQIQANNKMNSAQAKADEKIAEARSDFDKTREDYRHTMQSNLDTLDKNIADIDAKIMTATGKTKADLQAKSSTLHADRDAFANDVKALPMTTAATWDATKARMDKEWSDIKSADDKIVW